MIDTVPVLQGRMLSPVGLPSSRLAAPGAGGVVGLLPVEPFTYDVRKNNVVLLSPSSLRGLDEDVRTFLFWRYSLLPNFNEEVM